MAPGIPASRPACTRQIIRGKSSANGTINETSWINKARRNINSVCPVDQPGEPCTIFKVPQHIRDLDDAAYKPVVASFGPFHDDSYESYVIAMQEHKWRCARHLLSRHGEGASQLLDDCLQVLKKCDKRVRSCYSEELPEWLNAQELALIMFRDGCFIIYLMLKEYLQDRKQDKGKEKKDDMTGELKIGKKVEDVVLNINEEEDPPKDPTVAGLFTRNLVERKKDKGKKDDMAGESKIRERRGDVVLNIKGKEDPPNDPTVAGLFTHNLVVHDLLKLENQIPFFIIKLLLNQLKIKKDGNIDLVDLALHLFKDIHPKKTESFNKKSPGEFHHLLHLFYLSRILSEIPVESPSTQGYIRMEAAGSTNGTPISAAPKWIPTATELDKAGVKFKKKKLPVDCFLNITFKQRKMKITPLLCLLKLYLMFRSGRMVIPPLRIHDYTGPLFRNLIAFEQCYLNTKMYFTIYALFMDSIIDQAEDVRLLHLEGILEHKLSSDQAVAELFNKLGSHLYFRQEKNYLANQIEEINKFYYSKWHKWLAGLRRDYLGNPWAIISVLAAIFLLLLTVEQAIFSALSYFHSS